MLDVIASWEEVYNLATRPPKSPSNSAWFNVSIVCFAGLNVMNHCVSSLDVKNHCVSSLDVMNHCVSSLDVMNLF
jgi:hypothetical protein